MLRKILHLKNSGVPYRGSTIIEKSVQNGQNNWSNKGKGLSSGALIGHSCEKSRKKRAKNDFDANHSPENIYNLEGK